MDERQRKEWSEELRAARMDSARGAEEFERFADLVDLASGGGADEARVLMSTITNTPEDSGEGEMVASVLSQFPPEVRVRAALDELPRLEDDGEDDWSESIIETLVRECAKEFVDGLRASDPRIALIANHVLKRISRYAMLKNKVERT